MSLVVLLLLPPVLFAGGGGEAQKVTLRVWKAPYSDNDYGLLEAAFNEFKKAHPQVTIEFVVTPWETWVEKHTAAFAAGDPPEVFSAAQSFPYKFIQAGQVVALDKQGWAKALGEMYQDNKFMKTNLESTACCLLLLFLLFQTQFIEGMTGSVYKG